MSQGQSQSSTKERVQKGAEAFLVGRFTLYLLRPTEIYVAQDVADIVDYVGEDCTDTVSHAVEPKGLWRFCRNPKHISLERRQTSGCKAGIHVIPPLLKPREDLATVLRSRVCWMMSLLL